MALDYRKCAQEICDKIGGNENIKTAEYCQTRLRLEVLDDDKVDKDALEEIEGVRGVIESNGQLQLVIGTGTVDRVYGEFAELTGRTGGENGGNGSALYDGPIPGPGYLESVLNCLRQFATFSGRTRRSEYWYYTITVFVVNMLLGTVGNALGVPMQGNLNMLQLVFSILVFVPGMAVFWRRMHDVGKKGTWYLLNAIPLVGWLVLLAFELQDSQPGENIYGMSPKYPLKKREDVMTE